MSNGIASMEGVYVVKICASMFQSLLQCSGNMSASIASIEGYIRESEESQGSIVAVLKQGYLLRVELAVPQPA